MQHLGRRLPLGDDPKWSTKLLRLDLYGSILASRTLFRTTPSGSSWGSVLAQTPFFSWGSKKLLGNRPASPKAHRACTTNPSRGLAETSPTPDSLSYEIVTKNLLRKLGGRCESAALSMNKPNPFRKTKRSPFHVSVLLK
jgi:hypothetical protein